MIKAKYKSATLAVLGLALVGLLFQNCAKDMPDTGSSTEPSSSGAGNTKAIEAFGSTIQSATLTTTGGTWTNVPGVTMSIATTSDKIIQVTARGSATQVLGNQASGHCGFRVVVDGVPYGDPTWGDVIIQVYNWTAWSMERHVALPAGNHTIQLQQVGWNGTNAGCTTNANLYSAARMTVTAY